MATIRINNITFDPSEEPVRESVPTRGGAAPAPEEPGHLLVQTKAPLNARTRKQLEAAGARVLEYVPDDTYICSAGDLAAVRALPFVAWAGVYSRGFKVAPSLTGMAMRGQTMPLAVASARPERMFSSKPKAVDIVLHLDAPQEEVKKKVASVAGLHDTDLSVTGGKIRVNVQESKLDELATIDGVRHIEEAPRYKLHNNVARGILGVAPQPASSAFEGQGQIVAVADTGFDRGLPDDVHPAFAGRVVQLYALGRQGQASDPDGHGTHVCGSVLGDGDSTKLGRIQGTAPKASLVMQSVLDANGGLGGLPDDLNDLFTVPYTQNGARVHTNSWGSINGDGSYNSNSREVDDFVWKNRDIVICFAAGNEGRDGDSNGRVDEGSVTPPGTAKNCITIGASENDRPDRTLTYGRAWPSDFPAAPIASDLVANNPEGMVAFSSRGPVRGGRIKPDIVAPGTFILSTKSRVATNDGWAASDDPLYMFLGGTSMATPLVAGCAAVAREFLIRKQRIANPSAALVKALLINSAKNMVGQYVPSEAGNTPNIAEGFGRVDMAAVLRSNSLTIRDEKTKLDTGKEEQIKITVPARRTLFKATLVWTDPAGEGLQNDLDLIVRPARGAERHGNVPAASTSFDRLNNVEQVAWDNPPSGSMTVIVRANRITALPQSYALVVRVG